MQLDSIQGIIDGHKHYAKKIILKMDIEGSEWSALDAVKEDLLELFDQIVVEFHDLSRMIEYQFRERAMRVFDKLIYLSR